MKKILVCILFILGLLPAESKAQKIAVKSNLLYDATTTMNLGLEVALARKWTLDIPVNYNPWKFDDTRMKHWGIQPELRYWFCESFNRTFIGLHAHYVDFNVGGLPDWLENPLKVAPLIQSNLTPVKFFHSFILFILVFFVFFLSVMPGSTLNFVYKYNDSFLLLHLRSDSPKSSIRIA